jgi:hypothetical protein
VRGKASAGNFVVGVEDLLAKGFEEHKRVPWRRVPWIASVCKAGSGGRHAGKRFPCPVYQQARGAQLSARWPYTCDEESQRRCKLGTNAPVYLSNGSRHYSGNHVKRNGRGNRR